VKHFVKIAGRRKVLFGHLRRAFCNRKRFSVVGVRRAEGQVSGITRQSLNVVKSPHKTKQAVGCIRAISRGRGCHAIKAREKMSDDSIKIPLSSLVGSHKSLNGMRENVLA
jgi:hypothetical protein